MSIHSRRRAELERHRDEQAAAAAAADLPSVEAREPARPQGRHRKR